MADLEDLRARLLDVAESIDDRSYEALRSAAAGDLPAEAVARRLARARRAVLKAADLLIEVDRDPGDA